MNTLLAEENVKAIQDILIDQLDVTREQLQEDASIMGDLGADSLDVVEISMNLEEHFNITVQDEDWDQVKTVGDLYGTLAVFLSKRE